MNKLIFNKNVQNDKTININHSNNKFANVAYSQFIL